jgi:hypothetical protein
MKKQYHQGRVTSNERNRTRSSNTGPPARKKLEMCHHATDAPACSQNFRWCFNYFFFILSSKPLKLFNVNTNHFHTMFKALKLFSLNLLKIAYCIFVAKIMAKSKSAESESSKFFQHSGKISLS